MVGNDKAEEQQTFGSFRKKKEICRKHPAEIKHRGVFEGKLPKVFERAIVHSLS